MIYRNPVTVFAAARQARTNLANWLHGQDLHCPLLLVHSYYFLVPRFNKKESTILYEQKKTFLEKDGRIHPVRSNIYLIES